MVDYNRYPAIDDNDNFPPPIRRALANSEELQLATQANITPAINTAVSKLSSVEIAASEAVSTAMEKKKLVESVTAETVSDIVGGILDKNGKATWQTYNESGGPTKYAFDKMGLVKDEGFEASGGFLDNKGRVTWLTHDNFGKPTPYAVAAIKDALGDFAPKPTPTTAVLPTSNRHAMLESELRLTYGGTVNTNGAAPIVIVFDHGLNIFRDTIMPLLKARKLPAVMALNSDLHKPGYNIEGESANVTWDEINAWDSSIEIANHGKSHSTRVFTDSEVEQEVVGSLKELKLKLPSKKILTWVEPAIDFPGFNDGNTTDAWADTLAGRTIFENHAVCTGMIKSPTQPLFPRDGNIIQGMTGTWLDSSSGMTAALDQVRSAVAAKKGIIFRHHPRNLGGVNMGSVEQLTTLLDFLKSEQDAGRVKVLNLSQWSIADTRF